MSMVHAVPCAEYHPEDVARAVRACLEAVPAAQEGLRRGARVLLKPNIINPQTPESAVCTHPSVVKAVAEMCLGAGAEVLIADEPGYALAETPDGVFRDCGIAPACDGLQVEFELLKRGGYQRVEVPAPLQVPETQVARLALEADLIINLPRAKTHQLTLFTGAVKNMFGAIAPRERIRIHGLGTFTRVSEALADTFSACVPAVSLMDAVVGMEGKGPSHGTPRRLGLLLASADAVALDAVTEGLMGFRPGEVRVTTAAAEKGLGECNLDRIHAEGVDPEAHTARFERPPGGGGRGFPSWAGSLLTRALWIRPVIRPALCVRCGACAGICPGDAVTMSSECAEIDYTKCLECFCCQEVCPVGAIDTRSSWLARWITRGRERPRHD